MCSQTQSKMFGGAMPLGNGGNMPLSTVYQANPQPTGDVSSAPPPPNTNTLLPPPSGKLQGTPWSAGSGMYQQWAQRMNGGMNPRGGRMGNLPTMRPGGPGMMG